VTLQANEVREIHAVSNTDYDGTAPN